MSLYIHFTEEKKAQARQTDLHDLLSRQGEKLKKAGSEYEWLDGTQKVTIRGNLWYHQYEQVGGDAVDFVRKFYNKSYPDAVEFLLGGGYDEKGTAVHAHKRGTGSESTYKGNAEACDPRYSFHWLGKSNRAYLFEAPIDLLSFISMHKDGWRDHSYAAACGVSDQVRWQLLNDHPQIDAVYLCLDNDSGGQKAVDRIAPRLREKGMRRKRKSPTAS